MNFPEICTPRLRLRPFCEEDLESFAKYRNDPLVAKYQSWDAFDIEKAKELFENSCQVFKEPNVDSWYQCCISDRETNQIIGDCGIHFLKYDNTVEIGFTLASGSQHKGYAMEALSALIEYLFIELKIHRITATVDVRNTSCVKLLEKLKFRREGHFIDNIFFKGSWGSEFQYAMLRSEYTGNEKTLV